MSIIHIGNLDNFKNVRPGDHVVPYVLSCLYKRRRKQCFLQRRHRSTHACAQRCEFKRNFEKEVLFHLDKSKLFCNDCLTPVVTKHVEGTGMCRPYGWVFGSKIL